MYTQCPACKTVFRLHPDQINAAQGQVRCSRCHTVFNALNNLFQQATPDAAKEQPASPLKESSTVKAVSVTSGAIESSDPERAAGEHSREKDMAKRREAQKAPTRPERKETKQTSAVAKEQPASPLKETSTVKAESVTSGAIESSDPQRATGEHTRQKEIVKRREAQIAPTRPERMEKKQIAATEPGGSPKVGVSPRSSEQPPLNVSPTAVEVSSNTATGTAPSAAPPAVEQTLPLFEPDGSHVETTIKTANQGKQPRKPKSESPAKKSADTPPPLFEFNAAIDELANSTDADEPSTVKSLSGKKKPRPAPPQNEELDLITLSETQPSGEGNSLLFHYLPDENLTAELNPGDSSSKECSAEPDSNIQGKSNTHKATQAQPDYTLPLEHETTRSSLPGTMLWGIGITLMLAMLAMQYLYYHRMALAQEPRLRPLLTQMCRITTCQLPAQRDLTEIVLGKHLVQIHPRYVDSLLITATLVNNADFAQPFPIVEVVMTDLEQKQVARRRFLPNEYLIGSSSEGLLAPATEVPLMLEVLDPGKNAVGFEFNFY